MSTWKNLRNDAEILQAAGKPPLDADTEAEYVPAARVTVTSLEIDVEFEIDCDPYNRTGQFCVPLIDKYEKE